MTTTSPWLSTLTNFTCSSTLLELKELSVGQESLPSRVKLDINGTAFDFPIKQQISDTVTQDDSSKNPVQAKQILQFNPPLSLADGSYPITIAFQSNNVSTFSEPTNLESINLRDCTAATNATDNGIHENTEQVTVTDIETQSEMTVSSTASATQVELITSSSVREPQSTQIKTFGENTSYTQSEGESNVSHKGIIGSAVPVAILFCLLGLTIFLIIRRNRKIKEKRERSYYVFDNEFSDAEEGRY